MHFSNPGGRELAWLFPRGRTCPGCGRPGGREPFCSSCQHQILVWQAQYRPCRYCGRLLPPGPGDVCRHCQEEPPPFQKARSAGPYRGLLKKMIWAFKYQGCRSLAGPLGWLLARVVVRELGALRPDLLIPVPLTPDRKRTRTFNQAELLAWSLGQELNLRVRGEVLLRVKETIPQVSLSRSSRWQNLVGAFQVTSPGSIAGGNLLLVDDVLTTGATASACTRTLLAAGAARVNVVTLATGFASLPHISP